MSLNLISICYRVIEISHTKENFKPGALLILFIHVKVFVVIFVQNDFDYFLPLEYKFLNSALFKKK